MVIEHIALTVHDPVAFAEWYVEHLGMEIVRRLGPPTHTHFLRDSAGKSMLEVYNNPAVAPPDYAAMDPLTLHVAFVCEDVPGTRARLLAAGATPAAEIVVTEAGDELAMLRDPWGLAIQLANRAKPFG